jgi:hypothetical protein
MGRFVTVFYNARKKKRQEQGTFVGFFCPSFVRRVEDDNDIAFIVIFYPNLTRRTKDENKCNIHNHLLYKGTRVKKKNKEKKKG